MDIRMRAAAAKRPVSARPGKFPDYSDGARQADRGAHLLLDRLGARDLQRSSSQRSGRSRDGRLFRRPAAGCAGCLCADHLPNGSCRDGNPYGGHQRHGRGRSGPAGYAGSVERRAGRISGHPSHFRRPRAAGNGGAVKRVAGENGTILRGDANLAASAAD